LDVTKFDLEIKILNNFEVRC